MKCLFKSTLLIALPLIAIGAQAQTVTLDYYFNHEVHKAKNGNTVRFHYLWEDKSNNGFSILGKAFTDRGAKLASLNEAPTAVNLKGTDIYIIVDPDTKKENPQPDYIGQKDITEIEKFVKNGGVLVLMANDSANVELPHLNNLAARFGIHFNNDLYKHVIDDAHFNDGAVNVKGNTLFKTAATIFMKDICTISVKSPASAALSDDNHVIIATARYGKGTVLAVGDPWLYNEYVNGRLPARFENDKAANDLAAWLLAQVGKGN